jgi:pilus assembly protein Flp/PilA
MFLKAGRLCARMPTGPQGRAARKVDFLKPSGTKETGNMLRKVLRNNKAATAIEYGLIAALIAVAAITAMQGLGTSIRTTFNNAASAMNG